MAKCLFCMIRPHYPQFASTARDLPRCPRFASTARDLSPLPAIRPASCDSPPAPRMPLSRESSPPALNSFLHPCEFLDFAYIFSHDPPNLTQDPFEQTFNDCFNILKGASALFLQ